MQCLLPLPMCWLVCADLARNMTWLGHGQSLAWLVVVGREGEVKLQDQCQQSRSYAFLFVFSCHFPGVRGDWLE